MCLYPVLVRNPKYKENKKNGGKVPPVNDPRVLWVPIGCKDCIECRKQKARDWQIRLTEDIKTHKHAKFITFTFSNQSINKLYNNTDQLKECQHLKQLKGYELDNAIATVAIRLFLERHRKKYKTALRHFLITELGHEGTENIHIHGIIWPKTNLEEIEKLWAYGYVWKGKEPHKGCTRQKLINYVTERTVNYIIKYISKIDQKHKYFRGKIFASPGLGKDYTKSFNYTKHQFRGNKTNEAYKTATGHEMTLPIYYRNKIYTDEQKEKLWIAKLDKNIRYVGGERIEIHDDKYQRNYFATLRHYQDKNKRLGYGDGKRTWNETEEQEKQRSLRMQERLQHSVDCNLEPLISVSGSVQSTLTHKKEYQIQFRPDELEAIAKAQANTLGKKQG